MDANGGFVIAWMDMQSNNTSILARRFSQDGIPLGDILEVSIPEENTYYYKPSVSAGETGNFAICWYYHQQSNYQVMARRYDSDGSPVGEIYHLSEPTNSFQIYSAISLQNNRIFATWQDNRGNQTGFDIWANVYEWDSWVGLENEISFNKNQKDADIQIFPNPVTKLATISFTLQQPGNAVIRFTDNVGRTVKTLPLGNLTSGKHEIAAELSGLSKGMFICILAVSGEVIARTKVVVDNEAQHK